MATLNLLYKTEYPVDDYFSVIIPTVGDIVDDEDSYYNALRLLTAMPIDYMVELDDIGVDFSLITEWELFIMMYQQLVETDFSNLVTGFDMSRFEPRINLETGQTILVNDEDGIIFDKKKHRMLANVLRKIHHLERDKRKPANEEAKKYMIRRAREKRNRRKNRQVTSQLEELILALVNTEQFKYDFDSVRGLTIYQFNESVRQVVKKVGYDQRMYGIYNGTVDPKGLSQDALNWLNNK